MDNAHIEADTAPGNDGVAAAEQSLSGAVRYLRRELGMTQEELAQALGITVGTVSRWEKGRFRPSRLARALILDFARARNIALSLRPTRLG
jgi:putative transcriptional regulator